jgi:RsiW-degrading membrane proteinase PrsW (M82 family)
MLGLFIAIPIQIPHKEHVHFVSNANQLIYLFIIIIIIIISLLLYLFYVKVQCNPIPNNMQTLERIKCNNNNKE